SVSAPIEETSRMAAQNSTTEMSVVLGANVFRPDRLLDRQAAVAALHCPWPRQRAVDRGDWSALAAAKPHPLALPVGVLGGIERRAVVKSERQRDHPYQNPTLHSLALPARKRAHLAR